MDLRCFVNLFLKKLESGFARRRVALAKQGRMGECYLLLTIDYLRSKELIFSPALP
jgi:hypothetical protein